MSDLISRQDAIDAMWKALYAYEDLTEKQFMENEELELEDWFQHKIFVQRMHEECMKAVKSLPSADRPKGEVNAVEIYEKAVNDLDHNRITLGEFNKRIEPLKHLFYDRPTGEWTAEQVAEMLANLFGDECACNFNGIDEWLPLACKYANTQCPHPKEKHGCWMQFLIQGGGTGE